MEVPEAIPCSLYLIAFPALLLLSMFFSAAETAFGSASRLHIRYLREKKHHRAGRVERILAKRTFFLNTILVGNNIVNITLSSLGTAFAISLFGAAGVGIATVTVTILVLLFGEIIPKSIALTYPEKIALRFSLPLTVFGIFASPVVAVFSILTSFLLLVTGSRHRSTTVDVTEEDLRTLIEFGEEEGVLESEERDILHRILDFTDLSARDIMTPRPELVAVSGDTPLSEILELSSTTGFSRFPVQGDDIDDIRGIVYIKDILISGKHTDKDARARNIMRPGLFIFESQNIPVLQEQLQNENQNCAIILDEYGGTAGLVTIEDVFEEIFGNIQDEFDLTEPSRGSGTGKTDPQTNEVLIPGAERIETVNTLLEIQLVSRFYDTIAGFILEHADDIPAPGYSVEEQGHIFTVHAVSGNRIDTVRIEQRENQE